nr:immunoglobulin light chain junction region [Macaca mulatta]
CQHYNDLVLTF